MRRVPGGNIFLPNSYFYFHSKGDAPTAIIFPHFSGAFSDLGD
jgi:hypothetical protein